MTAPVELKVGDRVRIKDGVGTIPPETRGKFGTVLDLAIGGHHVMVDGCRLRGDGKGWFIRRSDLRKLPDKRGATA